MYQRMTLGVMKDKATGEYTKDVVEYIKRVSDGAIFPCVPENKDYQRYLTDLKAKVVVTDFDYAAEELRQAEAEAQTTAEEEKEALITAKSREMAEAALIAEGKLTAEK